MFDKGERMERYFNTEGLCDPNFHYMVPLDDRLKKIKKLFVDRGKYFVINRGRQYGKTTTLRALAGFLREDYVVLSMDFQMLTDADFENERKFVIAFVKYFIEVIEKERERIDEKVIRELTDSFMNERFGMTEMFSVFSKICGVSKKPIVLLIDEVDSASNNRVFLGFLALLRGYYLERPDRPAFHSVILAGVYDIKNLKLKIRPDEAHQYNSPWNISAKFNVDMSFSPDQIALMLREYEKDYETGMEIGAVSQCIYDYTSGYPYLVSAICKLLDEELPEKEKFAGTGAAWTEEGIWEAVQILLKENTTLFDSMVKQLDSYKELRNMLEQILSQGRRISYSPAEKSINLGTMFGFLKEEQGQVVVANRIFEMYLLNLFMTEEAIQSEIYFYSQGIRNQFVSEAGLDMELVLKKFTEHFTEVYGGNDEKFLEVYGRKFFLLYLKPIINGVGNYYIEAQTRDAKRTDLIVDYLGKQYIVELKIWHGNEYNERGEKQLLDYLDYFHLDKGYMLSFNFNKKKKIGVKEIGIDGRTIVEAVV